MDKYLERLKSFWPQMNNHDRKKMVTVIEALARPNHPFHVDITAIMGDAGKTPHEKNQDIDGILDPWFARH